MAAVCQVTGAVPGFGHSISHSHRRTKRRFDPNVQKKTYYVPSLRRNVTLNVSAKGIKVIDARGIESVVKDLHREGCEALMAKKAQDVRPIIKLRSTAGTGYTYVTRKNRRNNPDRIVLKKYDPVIRKHVEFREER